MFFKHEICQEVVAPTPILEPFILESPKHSYFYAKQVLKKRWNKAEKTILEDPEYTYLYAKNVLKQRWKEGEKLLIERVKDTTFGYWGQEKARDCITLYAMHVVKSRWKEVECYIAKSPLLGDYLGKLKDKDIAEFKNMVTLTAMGDGNSTCAKRFFSWNPTHVVKMKGSKAFEIMLDENRTSRFGATEVSQKSQYKSANTKIVIFQRAFTLREWLDDSNCSIELNHDDNEWYWKRQVNHYNWGSNQLALLTEYKLKGDVRPVR